MVTVTTVASDLNEEMKERWDALVKVASLVTQAMIDNPATLQKSLENRPIFTALFTGGVVVIDRDGKTIADFPELEGRRGANYIGRSAVATALREGKASIGQPVLGKVLKKPLISMVTSIKNAQGKIIGALSGNIDLGVKSFLDRIGEGRYGKSGDFLLVAPRYRLIVTASDKRRVLEAIPAPGVNAAVDRFVAGYEGTAIFVNPHGVEVLSSVKRLPVADWYVAVSLPIAEAFAPVYELQRRMLLATILLTMAATGVTWWVMRRQLWALTTSAKAIDAMAVSTSLPHPLWRPQFLLSRSQPYGRQWLLLSPAVWLSPAFSQPPIS